MTKPSLPALAAVALCASAALAEGHPCRPDLDRLCKDVKPGGGRLLKCLREHEADVSDACKAAQARWLSHLKEVEEECHDDVANLCHEVKPGGGRVVRCLHKHRAELTDACKAALEPRRKRGGPKGKPGERAGKE